MDSKVDQQEAELELTKSFYFTWQETLQNSKMNKIYNQNKDTKTEGDLKTEDGINNKGKL